MSILLVIFGLISGSFFSVVVGLIGSNRRIGFGWAFILSLLLSPLIGLLITLLSEPLPYGSIRNYGCLPIILATVALIFVIPVLLAIFGVGMLFLL
ncbi:MAG: hypothetical protein R3Y16_02200 [Rikenellaceae bacterium]